MKKTRQVRRFDFGELRSATRTPQGFLMCPGFATRTGVFPYMDGSGNMRRELRHPDDVFAPESLITLKNAPVTIEHPPVMIDPSNVSQYRKGHTTDRVEVNRDMVDVDMIVEDQDAIDAVEKQGMRELSSGYTADIVEEEGTYNGAPYDFRQKNIVYNHLAIVKRGRAGPEVRLRLDSADAVMQGDPEKVNEAMFSQETGVTDADVSAGSSSKKVVILGREVDLPSDVADTVQDLLDRFDEMRAKQSLLEDEMKAKRKDQKDVDVSQPGVSPQVKVEQGIPDGKGAPGKTAAQPGSITGGPVGKADDEEEEKEDGEKGEEFGKKADDEEKEDDEPSASKGEGAMQSPLDLLRKDADDKKAAYDDAKAKMDEAAAASMNQPEKKPDGEKMDSADVQKLVRARAKLERQAEKLVPFKVAQKFDSMTDNQIMSEVIKYRHPKADLEGKGRHYLQSRFDSIVESLEEDGTRERQNAGKALLGVGGDRMDSETQADPGQARMKMIQGTRAAWQQPLSASKK